MHTPNNTPNLLFDRSKPFYPLIINYLAALHGVKDLALSHVVKLFAEMLSNTRLGSAQVKAGVEFIPSDVFLNAIGASFPATSLADLFAELESKLDSQETATDDAHVRQQFSDLESRINPLSELKNAPLSERIAEIETNIKTLSGPLELKSEFQDNHIPVEREFLAKEFADNFRYLLEFNVKAGGILLVLAYEMTHSFHDHSPLWEFLRHCRNAVAHNGFNFRNGEPKYLAEWGKFHLTSSMQGLQLFKAPPTAGLLSLGDPLRLLWDIEQAFPGIKI